jgi:hypothetical protein
MQMRLLKTLAFIQSVHDDGLILLERLTIWNPKGFGNATFSRFL